MAIHPDQVEIINDVFTPTADEVADAKRLLEADAAARARGEGVYRVDDRNGGRARHRTRRARCSRSPNACKHADRSRYAQRIRRLDDRVELARVRALLARTVARLLSPAERDVVVEAGGRQVHHHQPARRVPLEVTRVLERRRDDARRETVRRVVGRRERRLVVLHANHGRDRPEHFLAIDPHRSRRLGEQRRRHVEAVGLALEALAAVHELRAFLLADRDVLEILLELPRVDDRADLDARLQAHRRSRASSCARPSRRRTCRECRR